MNTRLSNLKKLQNEEYDVLIIGGGINGAVSAASLSTKGAKVALIDKGDFAGFTSSNSSNLVWGGIKYLESHEYLLINKLCKSRNHLMKSYPSTVKEIRFLTTIQKGFRFPPYIVFLSTIIYWTMGRFITQAPHYLSKKQLQKKEAVINTDNSSGGFEYSDCYLFDNDARFVFNFILSALNEGCIASNYVKSFGSKKENGAWITEVRDVVNNKQFAIRSKVIVNACGPYVDKQNEESSQMTEHRHLFSKGIHLIVDRISSEERILTFFANDGRLFFVIPMGTKTCIGTTDTQVESPNTTVTDEDRDFVLENVNAQLKLAQPLLKSDIISERCGVRPLALKGKAEKADWLKLSRKHAIDLDKEKVHLSIFGGKLTDCINVGDEIADLIFELGIELNDFDKIWYGEPNGKIKANFLQEAQGLGLDDLQNTVSEPVSERLWRRYGLGAFELLEVIRNDSRQSEKIIEGQEFLRCEIEFSREREMITKLEDFLRRRSKVSQTTRHDELISTSGIREVCKILFAEEADAKFQEYIKSKR